MTAFIYSTNMHYMPLSWDLGNRISKGVRENSIPVINDQV